MSAPLHGRAYTVRVVLMGSKGPVASVRRPYGDEDVEELLLDYCGEHFLVLGKCHVTLNGRVFHMHKGMKVEDLPDDPHERVPCFVIHS